MTSKNTEMTKINGIENKFEIFDYNNLGSVRAYLDKLGNKWFCLKDVCDILGLQPNKTLLRLNIEGRNSIPVLTNGGPQQMNFINDGNLFMLITGSRKPEAKKFTMWVCNEVLPSLNKKGYYIMDNGFNIQALQEDVSKYGLEIKTMKRDIRILKEHADCVDTVTNNYYATLRDYSHECNKGINLKMAKYLGCIATQFSMEYNVEVLSKSHARFGSINMYRRDILKEVFENHYVEAYSKFGDEDYTEEDIDNFYNGL